MPSLSFGQWMSTGLPSECAPPDQLMPISNPTKTKTKAATSATDDANGKQNKKSQDKSKTSENGLDGSSKSQTLGFGQWMSTGLPSEKAPPDQLVPLSVKPTPISVKSTPSSAASAASVSASSTTTSEDKDLVMKKRDSKKESKSRGASAYERELLELQADTSSSSSCSEDDDFGGKVDPLSASAKTHSTTATPMTNHWFRGSLTSEPKDTGGKKTTKEKRIGSVLRNSVAHVVESTKAVAAAATAKNSSSNNGRHNHRHDQNKPRRTSKSSNKPKLDVDDVDNIYEFVKGMKQNPQGQELLQQLVLQQANGKTNTNAGKNNTRTSDYFKPKPPIASIHVTDDGASCISELDRTHA